MIIDLKEIHDTSSDSIWQLILEFYEMYEIYSSSTVKVACTCGEIGRTATLDITASVIVTELFDMKSIKLLLVNQGNEKPYIGKTFGLEDLKSIAPGQIVIATPLGGDDYLVDGIGVSLSAIYNKTYTGSMYGKIAVSSGEVYNATMSLGSAGGDVLVCYSPVTHPFENIVSSLNIIMIEYFNKNIESCMDNIGFFIGEMLRHICNYNSSDVVNNPANYPDKLRAYIEIYRQTYPPCDIKGNDKVIVEQDTLKEWITLLRNWVIQELELMKVPPIPSYLNPETESPTLDTKWISVDLDALTDEN